MNMALQIPTQPTIKDLARRHSIDPLNKMGEVLIQHTEELMHTLQQQVEQNRKLSARIATQEARLQELRERDLTRRADTMELLERFIELNLNNYGPEDVDQQQAWALEAFDHLQTSANAITAPHSCDDLGPAVGTGLSCSVCGQYAPFPF